MLNIPIKFFPLTILYDILPTMKKLFKNKLFIGISLFVLFFVTRIILILFGLMFRAWINCIWLGSSFLIFIWGIFDFYNRSQNKIAKGILSILIAIALIFTFFPMPMIEVPLGLLYAAEFAGELGVLPSKEDVIEYNGYKIVGYHRFAFWDTEVDFYEYKNLFFVGSDCLLYSYGYSFDREDGHFYAYDEMKTFTIEDIVERIKN
ncbi:hypothetical protein SAMN02910382_02253 [Butyrivibrio sp. TB]|nr:hypothetical protein SAMN02910382_02253 [Butyrivibrio sp. TB]